MTPSTRVGYVYAYRIGDSDDFKLGYSVDVEWLKTDEPELYEKYCNLFDKTRFRLDYPKVHKAHLRHRRGRPFAWIRELVPEES